MTPSPSSAPPTSRWPGSTSGTPGSAATTPTRPRCRCACAQGAVLRPRPDLWAKTRPLLLSARAALSHGGRWRLPLVPGAHARLATDLSAKAVAAMADAFGPAALGGAEATEILAQHGPVALRPTGRRLPVAVLHLPGQPGAPRRPPIAFKAP